MSEEEEEEYEEEVHTRAKKRENFTPKNVLLINFLIQQYLQYNHYEYVFSTTKSTTNEPFFLSNIIRFIPFLKSHWLKKNSNTMAVFECEVLGNEGKKGLDVAMIQVWG